MLTRVINETPLILVAVAEDHEFMGQMIGKKLSEVIYDTKPKTRALFDLFDFLFYRCLFCCLIVK